MLYTTDAKLAKNRLGHATNGPLCGRVRAMTPPRHIHDSQWATNGRARSRLREVRTLPRCIIFCGMIGLTLFGAAGCESGFQRIDRRVEDLVTRGSATLGPDAAAPDYVPPDSNPQPLARGSSITAEQPATVNPAASELPYRAVQDADDVLTRLESYSATPTEAMSLDLPGALGYAMKHSREYMFAEEEYVLAALRLLIERHQWGPRFFNDTTAEITSVGDDGLFDTSLRLVNEFRVTQRLPYGGEISARALAAATEDLHHKVAGEGVQDATVILEADIPLLRGGGISARESRIQAERDLIYSAREFEDFRRTFFFDIAQDFLDLIVLQSSVRNAEMQVDGLKLVRDREAGLYEAGRAELFQKALAEQSLFSAIDNLNSRRESYRLSVDRFKVRLGMPLDQPVVIIPSGYDLPPPQVDLETAVQQAMAYRLDLQTQRDRVDDARRQIEVARNDILPDLNLVGSASLPTDPDKARSGLDFSPGDSEFAAGITFGLPLDREVERLNLRSAQIQLERARRDFDEQRDNASLSVRSAVRDIDRARYALNIQEQSVAIGELRVESIKDAPERATARDASDANNELAEARDDRDNAVRDLQVAILRYLLESGQLRVDASGRLLPLRDMQMNFIVAPVQNPVVP